MPLCRYLVDTRWYKQMRAFVDGDADSAPSGQTNGDASGGGGASADDSSHPGPVDNTALFSEGGAAEGDIREHMIDDLDYRLVPEEGWSALVRHFGAAPGQRPVARRVVEHGMFVKHCRVEVYFIELLLAHHPDCGKNNAKKAKFSKSDTLADVAKEMRRLFGIPDETETRLWNKYTADTYEQLPKLDNTVQVRRESLVLFHPYTNCPSHTHFTCTLQFHELLWVINPFSSFIRTLVYTPVRCS